jgi:pyruvate/2-oxoglutarate/acetoin dehydrogenase E1 component
VGVSTETISYAQAINAAMAEEMERDPHVFLMGQDVGAMGGVFGVTRGLQQTFGPDRVRDTAIVENFIVGGAVGAALGGMRPVAEVQFADFLILAGDEVLHKLAKWRYMHGGTLTVPVVVRAPCGIQGGVGAEHCQSPEMLLWHTAGLKVAVPSTPADAKGLLKSAIRDDDPVVFLEHRRLYRDKAEVAQDPEVLVPFGAAVTRRPGKDITIVTWSAMVQPVLEAAERLSEAGVEAEVVDPRTLVPFDREAVAASVRRTGRLLVVHEAPVTAGPGAEVVAQMADDVFEHLDAPVRRLGGPDAPVPQNLDLERFYLPSVDDIVDAAQALVRW